MNHSIESLISREGDWIAYYKATDEKHFGDRSLPGSKFSDLSLKTLEDVAALAIEQRGNLDGDDRAVFIKHGASKDSFHPDIRYIYVETPGVVGVIYSSGLPDGIPLHVARTKPGIPCSVIYTTYTKHVTTHAVIIIIKDDATGQDKIITAHPGMPNKPKTGEFDHLEGEYITLGQARAIVGGDMWLETTPA